ncbi:MAG: hypothetical protein IIU40_07295 [Lachnospiraceae bacterium]|nr:hypothetical protein [Lachnospiraceae bacterium]
MNMNIPGIDTEKAIKNLGSESLFLELLGDVYKLMDEKCAQVTSYVSDNDLHNYTILVHSLKTTCRMIGAMDLGEEFFTLEKLGKENNLNQIQALTPGTLQSFRDLKPYLTPFAANDNTAKAAFDKDTISRLLNTLADAIDDFDLGTAEDAIKQLHSYNFSDDLAAKIDTLDKFVANLDYDEAKSLVLEIQQNL